MTTAMVFPGQGSQAPGMQSALAVEYPVIQETYAEASALLGYDLWQKIQSGDADALSATVVTQPAMLAAGVAAYRAWIAAGGAPPAMSSGHSLGEYTALTTAGAVSFADAMRVVIKRSELMATAVPEGTGGMAAVLGLDDEAVIAVCDHASGIGVAEPVNFNSPGQVVIAGHRDALDRAVVRAKEVGAKRAIILPVSVPSHSSLMMRAGEALREALAAAEFETPERDVYAATDGAKYGDANDIRDRLARQVYAPVHWVQTVNAIIAAGATQIIECGPGKVLAGLCRRIDRSTTVNFIESPESLVSALPA